MKITDINYYQFQIPVYNGDNCIGLIVVFNK